MTRKIHISVMAYDGNVPVPSFATTLGAIQKMVSEKQWNVSFHFRAGDSILPRARNAEASNFLEDKDATDFVMIDADTWCGSSELIKLIDAPVDIIGAPYRTRTEPLVWASVRWLHQDVKPSPENGLLQVDSVGTGLIRIKRPVIEKMVEGMESYRDPTAKSGSSWPVFWFTISGGHLWGEDISFCQAAAKLGFKVWADPSIATAHRGSVDFTASLEQWLADSPPSMNIDDVIGKQTLVKNFYSKQFGQPATEPAPATDPLASDTETNIVSLPQHTKSEAA